MIETWDVFTGLDILLGLLGAVGFLAVVVVIVTAGGKVNAREQALRAAVQIKREQDESSSQ